jgi:DegV family protein with EDD domain
MEDIQMQSYCLLTGSTADLPPSYYKDNDIIVMPYPFFVHDREYAQDPFAPFDYHAFYQSMRNGALPTTSNLNQMTISQAVKGCFDEGKDVLYVVFSHGLSSTYEVAVSVQQTLKEQYPDRKLVLVDSLCGSFGQGILALLAARYRKEGLSLEENAKKLEDIRLNIDHLITVSDLGHLFRGGRISRAAATMGKLAYIKPIITIDRNGFIVQREKVNGRRKSIRTLAKIVVQEEPDVANFDTLFVFHGDCLEDAEKLKAHLAEETGMKHIEVNILGPVIGSHTGPDMLGVCFLSKHKRPQ